MSQYPMNDLRNPLGKAFYDLTQQVEALGGSSELTAVVVAIGALRDQVGAALATKPQAEQEAAKGDSARLDAMQAHRIAVVPEFEGPWDAELYGEEGEPVARGSGNTPREAIDDVLRAARASNSGGAA